MRFSHNFSSEINR